MKLSPKQYATALYESLAETAGKDHDKVLDNFVDALAKNNDLKLFDKISEEFHKLELNAKGQQYAEVTTARPLSHDAEKDLIKELNGLVNGKVELKKRVDAGIVGGVVVQIEDTVIDASTKRALENLKEELSN